MGGASWAYICLGNREIGVCDKVSHRFRASESEHRQRSGVIDGNVACDVRKERALSNFSQACPAVTSIARYIDLKSLLLELIDRNHIIGLHKRTVARRTSDLGIAGLIVVVARAVCCRSKLLKEVQIRIIAGRNRYVDLSELINRPEPDD